MYLTRNVIASQYLIPVGVMSMLARTWNRLFTNLSRPETHRSLPNPAEPGRDCVVVLDVSPSMLTPDWRPNRLEGARNGATAYVNKLAELEAGARVAIVSYARRARRLCRLTPVHKKAELTAALKRLRVTSWTNITAGLTEAHKLLKNGRRVQQVILLTDGAHNTGRKPYHVADLLKQTSVLECIGIGARANVDEVLLRKIASERPDGTKRYRWIGDPEELEEHYRRLAGRITRA